MTQPNSEEQNEQAKTNLTFGGANQPQLEDCGFEVRNAMSKTSSFAGLVGKTIGGHYLISGFLGKGGMSVVYKAKHVLLKRDVAVKFVIPNDDDDGRTVMRFEQEAKAATALNHPNIVRVSEYGTTQDGLPFLVMDFVEGECLSDIIKKTPEFGYKRVAALIYQIADALECAHKKGIIHRDVKPGNVIVSVEDGKEVAKVLDFGIAKILPQSNMTQQHLTQTGEIFGSPLYMSPEQCMGKTIDTRADIYSLGVLTYELLDGRPPFQGENPIETIFMHLNDMPPIIEGLPEMLQQILDKALDKDPAYRYQSMGQMKTDLEKYLNSGESSLTRKIGLGQPVRKIRREKTPPVLLITFIGLAVLAGGALSYILLSTPSHRFRTVEPTSWVWQEQLNRLSLPQDDEEMEQLSRKLSSLSDNSDKVTAAQVTQAVDTLQMLIDRNNGSRQEAKQEAWFADFFGPCTESVRHAVNWAQHNTTGATKLNALLHKTLGDLAYHQKHFQESADEYESAANTFSAIEQTMQQACVQAYARWGDSLYFEHRYSEARKQYARALRSWDQSNREKNYSYAIYHARLGDCCRYCKQDKEAKQHYLTAQRVFHDMPDTGIGAPEAGEAQLSKNTEYESGSAPQLPDTLSPSATGSGNSSSETEAGDKNEALCTLWLAALEAGNKISSQYTDLCLENLNTAFPKSKYLGYLYQDFSNVLWEYGQFFKAINLRLQGIVILNSSSNSSIQSLPLDENVNNKSFLL